MTGCSMGCDAMQGYLASRPLHGGGKLQAWFDALAPVPLVV